MTGADHLSATPEVVIIAPEDEQHDAIAHCLMRWAEAGLVDPLVWWAIGLDESVRPPRHAWVLDRSGLRDEPPGAALVGLTTTPRVAVCSSTDHVDTFRALAVAAVRELDVLLSGGVQPVWIGAEPSRTDGLGEQGRADATPREWWGALDYRALTIAASQRTIPTGVEQLVDRPDLWPAHVAFNLAVLMGLWSPKSSLSEVPVRFDELGHRQGVTAQAYARLVDVGPFLDLVGAHLGAGAEFEELGVAPTELTDDQITTIAHRYLTRHEAIFSLPPPIPPPAARPPVGGLLPYLRIIAQMAVDLVRRIAIGRVDDTFGRLHDRLAGRLEKVGLRVSGRTVERYHTADEQGDLLAEQEVVRPEDLASPTSAAWQDLVFLTTQLVDGRDLPEWKIELDGRRVQLAEVVPLTDDDAVTVLGEIRAELDRRIEQGHSTIDSQRAELEEVAPDGAGDDPVERRGATPRRRRLRRWLAAIGRMIGVVGTLLTATALAIVVLVIGIGLGDTEGIVLVVSSVVVWFTVTLLGLFLIVNPRSRKEEKEIEASERRDALESSIEHCTSGVGALERRRVELDLWIEVLAASLTTPHQLALRSSSSSELGSLELPPAFGWVQSGVPDEWVRTVRGRALRRFTQRPWRTGLFLAVRDHVRGEVAAEIGASDASEVDPFADEAGRTNRALMTLAEMARDGRMRALRDQHLADQLRREVVSQVHELWEELEAPPRHGSGRPRQPIPLREFLDEIIVHEFEIAQGPGSDKRFEQHHTSSGSDDSRQLTLAIAVYLEIAG